MTPARALALGAGVVLVWSEWQHLCWSRSAVGAAAGPREAVVVLGFRNRGARANLVNRCRVRAALRSIDPGRDSFVVFSGGPVGSEVAEARIMAAYAAEIGYVGPVVLEETSRTTWENVSHVVPLVEDVDTIKIVSQPSHALKARVYLRRRARTSPIGSPRPATTCSASGCRPSRSWRSTGCSACARSGAQGTELRCGPGRHGNRRPGPPGPMTSGVGAGRRHLGCPP